MRGSWCWQDPSTAPTAGAAFVFAVPDIEAARQLTATDPVIVNGEMVAEYHKYFGSASLMLINEWHKKITKPES